MARPTHDPEALAKFQDGERRLVYARLKAKPDAPPYYLADGKAAEVRSWAKENLECFMPECRDRWLTTVARTGKRDGFTHRKGAGGHGLEGLFHEQGKALVARWIGSHYPQVRAVVEQMTTDRKRRSDVMLTWPSGRQVAVEVQYAALTPEQWGIRHNSYREQGIADVWLFGHIPPHLRQARARSWETPDEIAGQVVLQPVHYAVLEAELPLLWINPVDEQIGTCWESRYPLEYDDDDQDDGQDRPFDVPPKWNESGDHRARFGTESLAGCKVTEDGITLSVIELLREAQRRLADVEASRAERANVRRAAVEERRREAQRRRDAAVAESARGKQHAQRLSATTTEQADWAAERRATQAVASSPPSAADARGYLRCTRCHLPLDPVLVKTGRHIGC